MSASKRRQGLVQSDPVDASFDALFLGELRQFQQRFESIFPDQRLFKVFGQLLKGVIAAGVPIIARIAAAVIQSNDPRRAFHVAKRYYRWLKNKRFRHQDLLKPAYELTRKLFQPAKGEYVLVVLDFSNLEKPYGYEFEDLCILKATGRRSRASPSQGPGARLQSTAGLGYV